MVESFIIWIIVGAIAGWLAGMVVKGGGFGLIGDIVVGIIGAFIGGWLMRTFHFSLGNMTPLVANIVSATIGAVVLLLLLRLIRRA